MNLPKEDEWNDPGSFDPLPTRRRVGVWIVGFLLIALIGSVVVWRATSLRGLPDVGPPFDLAAFGTIPIPESKNAFTYYRAASEKLTSPMPLGPMPLTWGQASPVHRAWFDANRDALKIWLAGTTKDRAVYVQPSKLRFETTLKVAQDLRTFARLAQLAGLRMEGQGDLEEAWTWYRAGLRSSRHVGMYGTFIERLIGNAIYSVLANNVRAWADHPNLNVDLLRKSLDDILVINAMTPSMSHGIRSEYFSIARFLDDPNATEWYIHQNLGGPNAKNDKQTPFDKLKENLWRVFLREPERSRRVLRLVVANWLSVAELSPGERVKRRGFVAYSIPIYDPPADALPAARVLTRGLFDRWLKTTRFLVQLLPSFDHLNKAEIREEATRASLVIHLAEKLYEKDHGKPPESAETLVGPYLKALPPGYVAPISTPSPIPAASK